MLAVLGVYLMSSVPVAELERGAGDLLTRWAGPGTASGQVTIVEIDERSLAQYGRWPWSRDLVARLTQSVVDGGAAVVALDLMFPQEDARAASSLAGAGTPDGRTNDERLAAALSGRPVLIGYTLTFDGGTNDSPGCAMPALPLVVTGPATPSRPAFFRATGAICSVPAISRAAAGSGFLNGAPDNDGKVRHIPLLIESGGRQYPSLALAALIARRPAPRLQVVTDAAGARRLQLGERTIPLEGPSLLRLRFRGSKRSFAPVPASDLLAGRAAAETLRGRIVIVGGGARGLDHPAVTPVASQVPDVEIQATALDNLLQGDTFRRPGFARSMELLLALPAGLLSVLLMAGRRPLWGTAITGAMIAAAWAGCALALSATALLFLPVAATAVLAWNLPCVTLLNYLRQKRRADAAQREMISSAQRSLEVLRESEARYHRLVENVYDAIVVDDVEGRVVFANRRFREWFGLEDREVRGLALEDYVAPEWRAEVRDRHDRRMRGEAVSDHLEFEGLRRDGTRIWIEALVTALEENGRIAGSQAALRDVTERRRIEAQYLQAQKMESIGRLAGGVAHDFNNLLTVINGYCELLLLGIGPDDPSREQLLEIRKAGDHAAALTQKLLVFSRKQMVQPNPLNLNQVVRETEKMCGRLIGEDIVLTTRLDASLGTVMADAGQMHQVLMNLVVNARDSMPHGGTVIIETKNIDADEALAGRIPNMVPGAYVYLGVTDTGTGMSDEVKRHLFEPFFTTKEPGKGTGLGLATTYGIVRECGGSIGVTSELERGTAFHIYLPRLEAGVGSEPGESALPPALRGSETVLVVEDQDAVRKLATTVLESQGYRVLQASSGPDAIALAEGYPEAIHLLLTDVVLPYMDGRVLAEKLRAARPGLAVLYISGYTEERIGEAGTLDRALDYLPKPFTPEALGARVRQALTGRAREDHAASGGQDSD